MSFNTFIPECVHALQTLHRVHGPGSALQPLVLLAHSCGVGDTPAAFFSSSDAGGVLRMNVKLRSCNNMAEMQLVLLPADAKTHRESFKKIQTNPSVSQSSTNTVQP